MTASTNNLTAQVLDFGKRIVYKGKGLRMQQGAKFVPQTPQFFTHFMDLTVANLGFTTSKTDNAGASGAVLARSADSLDGTAVMTNSDAASADGSTAITPGGLAYKPSLAVSGKLVFEARLKVSSNTQAGTYFFGWTDNSAAETNDICYLVSSSSTLTTSNPTDAAGFVFSSAPSSGALYNATADLLGGVTTKADVDTVSAFSTTYINDGTIFDMTAYHVYRVEIDVSGNVVFVIDGKVVKTVASAVTASVAMCGVLNTTGISAAKSITVDYLLVGAGHSNGVV